MAPAKTTKTSKEDRKRKLEDLDQQVARKHPKLQLEPSKPSGLPSIVTDHIPVTMDFYCVLCNKLFATAKELFNHTKKLNHDLACHY